MRSAAVAAFSEPSDGSPVAMLVGDVLVRARGGVPALRRMSFAMSDVQVDLEVRPSPAAGVVRLSAEVRPPEALDVLLRSVGSARAARTDSEGRIAGQTAARGPFSLSVLGARPLQTEWLVL